MTRKEKSRHPQPLSYFALFIFYRFLFLLQRNRFSDDMFEIIERIYSALIAGLSAMNTAAGSAASKLFTTRIQAQAGTIPTAYIRLGVIPVCNSITGQ